MCFVSVVYRYGQEIPQYQWNVETLQSYQSLLNAAKQFDTIAHQPDCHDPEKERWYQELTNRVWNLEQRLADQEMNAKP